MTQTAEEEMKDLHILKVIFVDDHWEAETEDALYRNTTLVKLFEHIRQDKREKK